MFPFLVRLTSWQIEKARGQGPTGAAPGSVFQQVHRASAQEPYSELPVRAQFAFGKEG